MSTAHTVALSQAHGILGTALAAADFSQAQLALEWAQGIVVAFESGGPPPPPPPSLKVGP